MGIGLFLTILGGAVNGSFAAPIKKIRGLEWEHYWFIWAVSGLVVVPCVTGLLTIPDLAGVYSATSWGSIILTMLFGFGWGIAGFLFGLGIDRLGLALGYGLIIGISSALGAIGPLVTKHSDKIGTPMGLWTIVGVLVVVAGVAMCAVAGRIREQAAAKATAEAGGVQKGSLLVGLLICIASGVLAPMMNFGLVYGTEIVDNARKTGAWEPSLNNAVWPVLLLAGFIANAAYCGYLMVTRKTGAGPLLKVEPGRNLPLGFLMGLLWFGGLTMYGYAGFLLGPMGLVLGWPMMMGATVLTGLAWGIITGEWKVAPKNAILNLAAGVLLVIAGIGVISYAGTLSA